MKWWIILIVVTLIVLYLLRKYFRGPSANPKDMSNKIVIITGSSGGIGKQQAFELLKQGATVVFACRDQKKTLEVIEATKTLPNLANVKSSPYERAIFIQCDLSSFNSVVSFVKDFKSKFSSLDILCNNAGFMANKFKLTQDGLEEMAQTNHFSHALLTLLLLPSFNKIEGRVINLSSIAHSSTSYSKDMKSNISPSSSQYKGLFDSKAGQIVTYGNTKYANILFTYWLAEKFIKEFPYLSAYSLHPGAVNSGFIGSYADSFCMKTLIYIFYPILWFISKNELDGAQCQLYLCYENQLKLKNGGYYKDLKLKEVSVKDKNNEMRDYLMKETLDVINSQKISI